MANPHGSFIWYELLSPDPVASKAFYDAVVGWDIEPEPGMEGVDYRMIRRSDGGHAGGVLRLSEEMSGAGGRPVWLGYIAVDDVDATVAAVHQDGGKVMMPAYDMGGVGRLAMVADLQGAPFYVMTPTGEDGQASDVFSVDRAQHVRWNELSSSDPSGAIAFYTRHFGWKQEGGMPMGEMGDYQFLHHAGETIGAVMPKMPQMPVSMWSYYFGVDSIDRGAEAVRTGGGTIVQEPVQIPGGEYSLVAVDPQGAAFGLVGPRV